MVIFVKHVFNFIDADIQGVLHKREWFLVLEAVNAVFLTKRIRDGKKFVEQLMAAKQMTTLRMLFDDMLAFVKREGNKARQAVLKVKRIAAPFMTTGSMLSMLQDKNKSITGLTAKLGNVIESKQKDG